MKNRYEVRGDVTAIFLVSEKYGMMETLIDTKDFGKVNSISGTWFAVRENETKFYVYTSTTKSNKRKSVKLHRFLVGARENMQVDHINGNTLDNRTSINLRELTNAQNQQNRTGLQTNNKSGISGVSWSKKGRKWHSKISINKKTVHLGFYDDINEAERVVKEARLKHMPYSKEASSM